VSLVTVPALQDTVVADTQATAEDTEVRPWTTTTTAAGLLGATALAAMIIAAVPRRPGTTTTLAMTDTAHLPAAEVVPLLLTTTLRRAATLTIATAALLPARLPVVVEVLATSLSPTLMAMAVSPTAAADARRARGVTGEEAAMTAATMPVLPTGE
jgi:hypothetical protein